MLRLALADAGATRIDAAATGTAPDGARDRALGVIAFIVTALRTAGALTKVVEAIRGCLARVAGRRRVRLTVAGVDVEVTADVDVAPIVAALLAQPSRPVTGLRRALVVANARYDDPALAALRAPTRDGRTLAFVLSGGNVNDCSRFTEVMAAIRVERSGPVRPRVRPDHVIADKGYSSKAIRTDLRQRGIGHTIPERADQQGSRRLGSCGGRPPVSDKQLYKHRNVVSPCQRGSTRRSLH